MPKPNLSAMSIDALLKLRDDVEQALSRRAAQLRNELGKLSGSRGKVWRSSACRPKGSCEISGQSREYLGRSWRLSRDGYGRNLKMVQS
jgi:hypothetical protein